MKLFPFDIYPVDSGHFVSSPPLALDCWTRDRANELPGEAWYAVGMHVVSYTEIMVTVYEMADSFHGGVGAVLYTYIPHLSRQNLNELAAVIRKQQVKLATSELEKRKAAAYMAEVEAVRKELFGG